MTRAERITHLRDHGLDLGSATRQVDYELLIEDINDLPISRELTSVLKRIVDFTK